MRIANVLSIAGSDPSGGAGIQADLKAFTSQRTYGMAVITGLTAQNTQGVTAVEMPSTDFVEAQLTAIFDDIDVAAIKIGMLGTADMIRTVATVLRDRYDGPIVLDPVMRAKSGDPLLADDAVEAMRDELVPLATVLTPNLPEADALTGRQTHHREHMDATAALLIAQGAGTVLLKGGALEGHESPDLLVAEGLQEWLESPRIDTRNVHGAGCTLSSLIAARIALGEDPADACRTGKRLIHDAIAASTQLSVGKGRGPTHSLAGLWEA